MSVAALLMAAVSTIGHTRLLRADDDTSFDCLRSTPIAGASDRDHCPPVVGMICTDRDDMHDRDDCLPASATPTATATATATVSRHGHQFPGARQLGSRTRLPAWDSRRP